MKIVLLTARALVLSVPLFSLQLTADAGPTAGLPEHPGVAAATGPVPPDDIPAIQQTLSIEAAQALALRQSPRAEEARQRAAAAAERSARAAAADRPTLSANSFASKSSWGNILSSPDAAPPVSLMGIPPGTFLDQNITGMLPLYTGGRASSSKRAALHDQLAAAAERDASLAELALQTRIAFRLAEYRQALTKAKQQNLDASREQLRLEELRYQEGKSAAFALYRVRTAVATAQQELTNANRDAAEALYSLESTLGVSLASSITLVPTSVEPVGLLFPGGGIAASADAGTNASYTSGPAPVPPAPAPSSSAPAPGAAPSAAAPAAPAEPSEPSLRPLLMSAYSNRTEVLAAQERTRAAQDRVSRAQADFAPQVNAVAMGDLTTGSRGTRNGVNYTIGLSAGLPLFEGGALSAALREARAELAGARAAERSVRLQVSQEVGTAWLNRSAAAENVATMRVALQQAQEDYQVQQLRYSNGKAIQLEVMQSLAALSAARVEVEQAQFELGTAGDQLLRATGRLLPPLSPTR